MWPFKKQHKLKHVGSVSHTAPGWLKIDGIGFFGRYRESPDRRWAVAWSDACADLGIGGYRERGHGSYVLLERGQMVTSGHLERPHDGHVGNNGTFVLVDWLFGSESGGVVYAFDAGGRELLRHAVSANIANTALSRCGRFAAAQLCNSDTDDSSCLLFFDLLRKVLRWRQVNRCGWADSYRFDSCSKHLELIYRDGRRYRYTYDGDFLDSDRLAAHNAARPVSAYSVVEESQKALQQCGRAGMTTADADRMLTVLGNALQAGLEKYPSQRAKAYRLIGEIYEARGDEGRAIENYESAISIDPRVGVRRRLAKLRSNRG